MPNQCRHLDIISLLYASLLNVTFVMKVFIGRDTYLNRGNEKKKTNKNTHGKAHLEEGSLLEG